MASSYYGTTGQDVIKLQQQLNKLGAGLKVDGIWGKNTETAYQKYSPQLDSANQPANSSGVATLLGSIGNTSAGGDFMSDEYIRNLAESQAETQYRSDLLNARQQAESQQTLLEQAKQRLSPQYELPEGYEKVYVELGCGRGLFINTMAAEDPGALYIGAEGCKTILIRALAGTREAALPNVRYIDAFINEPASAFTEGSLAGIFLNFSDPWPKDRHADRRLTAPAKAEAYLRLLAPGGFASVKTDSEAFFRYSLETFTKAGFSIAGSACDIANTAGSGIEPAARAAATPTEYELRFRSLGCRVYQFTALNC